MQLHFINRVAGRSPARCGLLRPLLAVLVALVVMLPLVEVQPAAASATATPTPTPPTTHRLPAA